MRLVEFADQLWIAEGGCVPFFGLPFPTRMVVARLPAGLWVWSPVAFEQALGTELDALGPVAWLVAPNNFHHLALADWHAAYPEAQLCGLAEVAAKRDDLRFAQVLDEGPPPAWAGHIEQAAFGGSVLLSEAVFFHRPSRTAIFTDLVQNFDPAFLAATWKPWQARLAKWGQMVAPEGKAPPEVRASFVRRRGAREALATVMAWAPERVIMAHGEPVEAEGLAFLERSFSWLA